MPVRDRSVRPITLIGWTSVFYVVYCTAAVNGGNTTCRAPSDYGPENKVVCNVSYTDNLVLECPDPASQKAAFWKKVVNESYSVALCNAEGPECSLNDERNLTNQDSGLYFCRIPSDNGSNFHLAYVQISVLAPPSLLNVAYCHEEYCLYEMKDPYKFDDFRVTVLWNGIGPFHVHWKHNGSDFDCSTYNCEEENSTNSSSLVFHHPPRGYPVGISGYYSANVSNDYGSNVSRTDVELQCTPFTTPAPTFYDVNLADGTDTTLHCQLSYNSAVWLTVCYGKHDQSVNDMKENVSHYCTSCHYYCSGDCKPLPTKPHWKVKRNETGEEGCDELELDITVNNFSKDDGGKIFCLYGDTVDPYQLYTTYTLNYIPSSSKFTDSEYIIVGVVCTCGALLLTIVVASYIIWRRRKKCRQRGAVSDIQRSSTEIHHESDPLLSGETSSIIYSGCNRPRLQQSHGNSNVPENPQNVPALGFPQDTDAPDLDIPSDFLLDTNRRSNQLFRSSFLSSTTSCDPQSSAASIISSTSVQNPYTGRMLRGRDIDYHSLDLGVLSDFFTATDGKQSHVIYT